MTRRAIISAFALFVAACLLAQPKPPSPEATSAALDKMIAARKSQKELAQYVFDTHGCKSCHTVGGSGKLGFTEKGKNLTNGFEGCIRMLTAMNVIAQVSASQRSADEKTKVQRFDEFGCTLCHKIVPGKMGLTGLGTKLRYLHLGCVEVEKQLAGK
jgi:cytochrome c2